MPERLCEKHALGTVPTERHPPVISQPPVAGELEGGAPSPPLSADDQ